MYINFWYPVALSDEVTDDKPLQVQILGLKFIAFRDGDGDPHVLSDTSPLDPPGILSRSHGFLVV